MSDIFPGLITNREYIIRFIHVPTGNSVEFEGWVTQFADRYESLWNETPVYGRMDPMATFQRTVRRLTLGFDVVGSNAIQASMNLKNISKLIQFLYPTYTENTRSLQNTLSGGPIMGLKWTNLIGNKQNGGGASETMLYGFTSGFGYNPNVGDGGFLADPGVPSLAEQATEIARSLNVDKKDLDPGIMQAIKTGTQAAASSFIPKTVNINLTFTVLHTHLMGWSNDKFGGQENLNDLFPYLPSVPANSNPGALPPAGRNPRGEALTLGAGAIDTDSAPAAAERQAQEAETMGEG